MINWSSSLQNFKELLAQDLKLLKEDTYWMLQELHFEMLAQANRVSRQMQQSTTNASCNNVCSYFNLHSIIMDAICLCHPNVKKIYLVVNPKPELYKERYFWKSNFKLIMLIWYKAIIGPALMHKAELPFDGRSECLHLGVLSAFSFALVFSENFLAREELQSYKKICHTSFRESRWKHLSHVLFGKLWVSCFECKLMS